MHSGSLNHSGLRSQLGRRGRERDGGQREEKDGEDVRSRQMERGRAGESETRKERECENARSHWWAVRCEDSTAHQHQSEPNFSCPASIQRETAMATHKHISVLTALTYTVTTYIVSTVFEHLFVAMTTKHTVDQHFII